MVSVLQNWALTCAGQALRDGCGQVSCCATTRLLAEQTGCRGCQHYRNDLAKDDVTQNTREFTAVLLERLSKLTVDMRDFKPEAYQ